MTEKNGASFPVEGWCRMEWWKKFKPIEVWKDGCPKQIGIERFGSLQCCFLNICLGFPSSIPVGGDFLASDLYRWRAVFTISRVVRPNDFWQHCANLLYLNIKTSLLLFPFYSTFNRFCDVPGEEGPCVVQWERLSSKMTAECRPKWPNTNL